MEQLPHNPDDNQDPVGPEIERMPRSEIDMTGVIRQDDALVDVIGDAIGEAEAEGGEVPEWGARTLARALANERDDPMSGALHHFAVTGRVNKEAMAQELADLYNNITNDETREWINWLGRYIVSLPEPEVPPDQQESGNRRLQQPNALEVPVGGTPLEKVTAFFQIAFAEADARGQAITAEDARAVATVLAALLLNPDSEMARFADTGDANPAGLYDECQLLKKHKWRTADVGTWIERFEQHLATRADLGRRDKTLPSGEQQTSSSQSERGVPEHDDAFRAYLTLPGVDARHPDVHKNFKDLYIGSFDSIEQLVNELTGLPQAMAAIRGAAEGWGLADYVFVDQKKLFAMALETWDIVVHRGTFHVFMK